MARLVVIPDHWREHGVLAAVSGGADSTALLHLLAEAFVEAPERLAVGHVNHRLRGPASDGDAVFVRNLASEYTLRYFEYTVTPDDWQNDRSGSREAAARNIRYDFLLRTARDIGFRYIATAHTADDQVETVLHRILRGTGLSGLAGMSRFRQLDGAVTLVRPLLEVRRREILEFLTSRNKNHRTDSTNAENEFTRNRIRNTLLPELRERYNPAFDDALTRLARLASDNDIVLDELVERILEDVLLREDAGTAELDSHRLERYSRPTLREMFLRLWKRRDWPLREMGLEQWDRLVDVFLRMQGEGEFPGRITARHHGDRFVVMRILPQDGAGSEARS